MTCPACSATFDAAIIHGLTVCQNPACVRTLVVEDGVCHVAAANDTQLLAEVDRVALRKLRPEAWRADVKARRAVIMGGMAR